MTEKEDDGKEGVQEGGNKTVSSRSTLGWEDEAEVEDARRDTHDTG